MGRRPAEKTEPLWRSGRRPANTEPLPSPVAKAVLEAVGKDRTTPVGRWVGRGSVRTRECCTTRPSEWCSLGSTGCYSTGIVDSCSTDLVGCCSPGPRTAAPQELGTAAT